MKFGKFSKVLSCTLFQKSTLRVDSPVPLTQHDPGDLGFIGPDVVNRSKSSSIHLLSSTEFGKSKSNSHKNNWSIELKRRFDF